MSKNFYWLVRLNFFSLGEKSPWGLIYKTVRRIHAKCLRTYKWGNVLSGKFYWKSKVATQKHKHSVMNQILYLCSMERRPLQVFSADCQVFRELFTVAVQLIWSCYLVSVTPARITLRNTETRQDISRYSTSYFKVHSPARPLVRRS